MGILSVQSFVSSGYVGNAAATPLLQHLGYDVWPVHTVHYSNHPGHGAFTGRAVPAAEIGALITGLANRNLWPACAAVLSGYLGRAETGGAILAAVERIRTANPDTLYCCDPVMGDGDALYVDDDIPNFFKSRALPAADIVTPNVFEAALLTNIPIKDLHSCAAAARALCDMGPSVAVVTGLRIGNDIVTVAATNDDGWSVFVPHVPARDYGAGDAFSALFLGYFLKERNAASALGQAAADLALILNLTADKNAEDLQIVAALPALSGPKPTLEVKRQF